MHAARISGLPSCSFRWSPTSPSGPRRYDNRLSRYLSWVLTLVGVVLDTRRLPDPPPPATQLLAWARTFGTLGRVGVECTGSYGAALTRQLRAGGAQVLEVNQPDKGTRRRRGPTDTIDARAAARAVLSGRATAVARSTSSPPGSPRPSPRTIRPC
jgi:transposase